MPSFSAGSLGYALIITALVGTGLCGLISTIFGRQLTRSLNSRSSLHTVIVGLLPFIVSALLCGIAKTQRLKVDALLLIFGIPILLAACHTVPLFIIALRTINDQDIKKARMKTAWVSFAGLVLSIGISLLITQ